MAMAAMDRRILSKWELVKYECVRWIVAGCLPACRRLSNNDALLCVNPSTDRPNQMSVDTKAGLKFSIKLKIVNVPAIPFRRVVFVNFHIVDHKAPIR